MIKDCYSTLEVISNVIVGLIGYTILQWLFVKSRVPEYWRARARKK